MRLHSMAEVSFLHPRLHLPGRPCAAFFIITLYMGSHAASGVSAVGHLKRMPHREASAGLAHTLQVSYGNKKQAGGGGRSKASRTAVLSMGVCVWCVLEWKHQGEMIT